MDESQLIRINRYLRWVHMRWSGRLRGLAEEEVYNRNKHGLLKDWNISRRISVSYSVR